MKYKLDNFSKESETNVFVLSADASSQIGYTDGSEVEKNIYKSIITSTDRSIWSKELIGKIVDWPTEYHFSPVRHNLLRHIKFNSTDRILELGCGCGAITRQLGETGAMVTSIEGTLERAKSAAARCYDLPSVKIYCSNFQNVEFEKQYDYVTLIGVLEYAPMFFKGNDPFGDCLTIAKSALKRGGKLLIAIENRMGLKYFNGFGEDHVDKPYFGLEDRYNSHTAKTFGRHELERLLRSNGFEFVKFQFPFPDYKLPEVIIDESAFQLHDFKYSELIRSFRTRDYAKNRKPNFAEFMVWKTVSENNLVSELSNSFLVMASIDQILPHSDVLAIKYTTNRKFKYNTKTQFVRYDVGINVIKSSLTASADVLSKNLFQNLEIDKYYYGLSLGSILKEKIYCNDFEGFMHFVKVWLNFLLENGVENRDHSDKFEAPLKRSFIDCLPSNIIVQNQSLHFIDKEWEYNKVFTIKTLFIRYWLNEEYWLRGNLFHDFVVKHASLNNSTPFALLVGFSKIFGIVLDENIIKENFRTFAEIGEIVYGSKSRYETYFSENTSSTQNKILKKLKANLKRFIRLFN